MNIITPDRFVDYHEACPYCGEKTLYIEFDEWEQDGTPADTGVHVHCKNELDVDDPEYDPNDHSDMPYVNWMPVETRAARWCAEHVRIVERDDRKELAAWNAGEPIRCR